MKNCSFTNDGSNESLLVNKSVNKENSKSNNYLSISVLNNNNNKSCIYVDQDKLTVGMDNYEYVKCILCYKISSNSKFFKCCEQIVCDLCTNDWLEKKNNCPNCRAIKPEVISLPKYIQRLFDDLKFKCNYCNEGCQETRLTFSTVKEHEDFCEFNFKRLETCNKCKVIYLCNEKHDCVEVLLKMLEESNLEIIKLKEKLNVYIAKEDPQIEKIKIGLK